MDKRRDNILVYQFRKIVGKTDFLEQFKKIVARYKKVGYNMDILWKTACLVVNSSMVDNVCSYLIARRWIGPEIE